MDPLPPYALAIGLQPGAAPAAATKNALPEPLPHGTPPSLKPPTSPEAFTAHAAKAAEKAPEGSSVKKVANFLCKFLTGFNRDQINTQLDVQKERGHLTRAVGGLVLGSALNMVGRLAALAVGATLGLAIGVSLTISIIPLFILAVIPETFEPIFKAIAFLGEKITTPFTQSAEKLLNASLGIDKEKIKDTEIHNDEMTNKEIQEGVCLVGAFPCMIVVMIAATLGGGLLEGA